MNYAGLVKAINSATAQLQGRVAAVANQSLVLRNWMVGSWIIEFEQEGKDRAKYGVRLLEKLAEDLESQNIKGMGLTTPKLCRLFVQAYPEIRQTLSDQSPMVNLPPPIRQTLSDEFRPSPIHGSVTRELPTPLESAQLLRLSWSQLQELVRIDDPCKRAFFENECLKGNWSVRQLQRQIGSLLYERTGLSTNKKAVIERARKQEPQKTIADLIRDPYVPEFTGLVERPEYLESDLEGTLLSHLQSFLLELGNGFCFEARQKRITVGRQNDYIDLVFYHRRLRCHVLIDLKIRSFKHGDAGQMNFYLNWWKTHGMDDGDAPPIGIILCSDHESAAVEFATAGIDNKLFVSRYLVALPSAEKLRAFLEADRERIEALLPKPPTRRKPDPRKKRA